MSFTGSDTVVHTAVQLGFYASSRVMASSTTATAAGGGGGTSHTYKRPGAAGKHHTGVAPLYHPDRFEAEVVSGGLWYHQSSGCGSLALSVGGSNGSIPYEFDSLDEYVRVFDPLVLEEAKECVRSSWVEQCQGGHCVGVRVLGVEEVKVSQSTAGGRRMMWKEVAVEVKAGDIARAWPVHMIVVLSSVKPLESMSGLGDWSGAEGSGVLVAGVCQRCSVRDGVYQIKVKIHPVCPKHVATMDKGGCSRCVESLRAIEAASSGGEAAVWYMTPTQMLVSSEREFDALHSVKSIDSGLMKYILRPSLLVSMSQVYQEDEKRRSLWPKQAQHKAFIHYLKSRYDYKQLEAIEMTAAQVACRGRMGRCTSPLPFVLIQGPPGTGKTHTVLGVLNVWHLSAFQQYYSSMIDSVIEKATKSGSGLDSMAHVLGFGAQKPRILVCTPSNAACDELMARVMKTGFCDGNGKTYRPNIVRIGGDAAVDDRVRDRFLNTLVSRFSCMSEAEWHQAYQEAAYLVQSKEREGRILEASLMNSGGRRANTSQEIRVDPDMAHTLVDISQTVERLSKQIEKLHACKPLVSGANGNMKRQAVNELETLLLADAEMVFSTLSSTQRKIFKDASSRAPFHTVLIDEAGQASEVATLQPLTNGAKSVVLVGDPQQLPATIKSEAAKAVEMERSLFERLQSKGCPVALLSVQYRMHPEIRQFPSAHFYDNKLEDAPDISNLPAEPYHSCKYLGPYHVFDVASGKEKRGKNTGSLSNAAEAELAACLYMKLLNILETTEKSGRVSVAIITPYREQKSLLRSTFKNLCGEQSLNKVEIETIDSYQGRQVDVVILSCVRAGSSGGLGFVNDVRRMNVAITRARRSLWILGALSTLRANKEWESLIKYVCIVYLYVKIYSVHCY